MDKGYRSPSTKEKALHDGTELVELTHQTIWPIAMLQRKKKRDLYSVAMCTKIWPNSFVCSCRAFDVLSTFNAFGKFGLYKWGRTITNGGLASIRASV